MRLCKRLMEETEKDMRNCMIYNGEIVEVLKNQHLYIVL